MYVVSLVFFLFAYSMGIPTGEIPTSGFRIDIYPKVLADPIDLGNLLVQWNAEGKIFLLCKFNAISYASAIHMCQRYNMELVKIENDEQNRTINELFEKYTRDGDGPFWMAGNRLKDQETWRWLNDEPITYSNWARGEPNNAKGDEMCIELYRDFAAWNDERCLMPNPFVCENIPNGDSGYHPILDSNDINDDTPGEILPAAPSSETPVYEPDFNGNPTPIAIDDDVEPVIIDDYEYGDYGDDEYRLIIPDPSADSKNETSVTEGKTTEETTEVTTDNSMTSTARILFREKVTRTSYRKPPPPYIPPVDEEVAEFKESSDKESWSKPVLRLDAIESKPKETPSVGWSDREYDYYSPMEYHGKEW